MLRIVSLNFAHPLLFLFLSFNIFLPTVQELLFNYTNFNGVYRKDYCYVDWKGICLHGNAIATGNGVIELTGKNSSNECGLFYSKGAAVYSQPIQLWNYETKDVTSFQTEFYFKIIQNCPGSDHYGDGFAFFISRFPINMSNDSRGGDLGLVSVDNEINQYKNNSFLAVEVDTYENEVDRSSLHVGIDVNSIRSVVHKNFSNYQLIGPVIVIQVDYNSKTFNLSVSIESASLPNPAKLSTIVDIRDIVPENVSIGFISTTGEYSELNQIERWKFSYNKLNQLADGVNPNNTSTKKWLVINVSVSILAFVFVCSSLAVAIKYFSKQKKKKMMEGDQKSEHNDVDSEHNDVDGEHNDVVNEHNDVDSEHNDVVNEHNDVDSEHNDVVNEHNDVDLDDEFERRKYPRQFSYADLVSATDNFNKSGKLGQGGFGLVYKGFMKDLNTHVAVKRISNKSQQGRKEYIAEVKIISQLRHKNLVQLIGWCHQNDTFIIVYELMENGSLDSYIFNTKKSLAWPLRFNIVRGLASSLQYLHDDGHHCTVHRDIKCDNIMLDRKFNAKLGDFGLARLSEHGCDLQTTLLAGTRGYIAPECFITGKCSKESDVYSFGIVALEIACGRRCIKNNIKKDKANYLPDWVWKLHEKGKLLEAIDTKLRKDNIHSHEKQIQNLMMVGLWCAHPDATQRPSMSQAIAVLNSESPLPNLPSRPIPLFATPSCLPSDNEKPSQALIKHQRIA